MKLATPCPFVPAALRRLCLLAMLFVFVWVPAPAVRAASIVVATTADSLVADGICSLREAIIAVNTQSTVDACAGAGVARIGLPAGAYTLSLSADPASADTPSVRDLDITHDLTIAGAGAAATSIDGGGIDGVLDIASGTVTFEGLTIQGGDDQGSGIHGGGIRNQGVVYLKHSSVKNNFSATQGGGILNGGVLFIQSSVVSYNQALESGGGIYNLGTLQIVDSTLEHNAASEDDGGGIYNNHGSVALVGSHVFANIGSVAGGIVNIGGRVELSNTTVSGNRSPSSGSVARTDGTGGIFNSAGGALMLASSSVFGNTGLDTGGIHSSGVLTITGSTLSGNTGGNYGGGLTSFGQLRMVNSTISGNQTDADGGGLHNRGTASLLNVTIADNRADFDANGVGAGGGIAGIGATTGLTNTVIDANRAGALLQSCAGALRSFGHNLISAAGGATGCAITGSTAADLASAPAGLVALAANGGPTLTHALLPGSPLLDAGDAAACPATDQRGFARPADGDGDGAPGCDIGAFELGGWIKTFMPIVGR